MLLLKNSFALENTFITFDEAPLPTPQKVLHTLPHALKALVPLIQKADVVSFDVFDTLLIRPFAAPVDIFLLIEHRSGIKGFCTARVQAESKARAKFYTRTGLVEVTLEQIYQELKLPKAASLQPSELMQMELETEKTLLTRSPQAGALYDLAIRMGKTVIAVSDMYLPANVIAECLANNGMPVSRVFVSCAHRVSKHEGKLHTLAARAMQVEPTQIVHFGDNFKADCAAALEAGTVGYFLPSLHEQLCQDTRYNQQAISALTRRNAHQKGQHNTLFTAALLAYLARFKATNPQATMAQIFGAMYAGPLVTGFALWLNKAAQTDNIAQLRLVTRDGYITKKVLDHLGFSGHASILQSSRRLTLVPALCTAFEPEIENILSHGNTCSLRACITRLNLGPAEISLLEELSQHTDIDQTISTPPQKKAALEALKSCKASLLKIAEAEKAAYTAYLATQNFDPQHDALVDCGWSLSSHRRTDALYGQAIKGYYVGSLKQAHMHHNIRSFLFHKGGNPIWRAISERGIELLELPFTACEAQVCRFEITPQGVVPVYVTDKPQYSHASSVFIKDTQDEILNFADFIKPFIESIDLEDVQQSLLVLFNALVLSPTPYEYNGLATLPHGREIGASDFSTIGTFWHGGALHAPPELPATKWHEYAGRSWRSLKQDGLAVTWGKIKHVLRHKIAHATPHFQP